MHNEHVNPSASTVTLLGLTRNSDNYGVRVLLSAAAEAVSEAFPNTDIEAVDYGVTPEVWEDAGPRGLRQIRLINLRFSWKLHLPNNAFRLLVLVLAGRVLPNRWQRALWARNPWLDRIARARVHLSIAGGDSFSDIYGFRRFLYIALPQMLVLAMKRPLVQLPQTYGPFRSRAARAIAALLLRHSRAVFSRDEAGVRTVGALLRGRGTSVRVVPDIGLGMSVGTLGRELSNLLEQRKQQRPLVGINPSGLLLRGGYTGGNMFGLRDVFSAVIDDLVKTAVEKLDANVILVPHVVGVVGSEEDESRVCERLAAGYRKHYGDRVFAPPPNLDHRQMKRLIGYCDFFTGARMHACVAAVSQCVPTLCLAYSDKFAGVMKPLGSGAHVADLRTLAAAEISQLAERVFGDRDRHRAELGKQVSRFRRFSEELKSVTGSLVDQGLPFHQLEPEEVHVGCPAS